MGYPYIAQDEPCKKHETVICKHNDVITNYTDVKPQSEEQLQAAVAQGPVSVAIEADMNAFQSYKGGVITANEDCGSNLDHGVLAVGYGTTMINGKKVDFWKVKNSWGSTWGEKGYVR